MGIFYETFQQLAWIPCRGVRTAALREAGERVYRRRPTEGRYLRDLEAQLIAHCGGAPSITQRLLIKRLIRTTMQLHVLDAKLLAGDN
jgi:hypothetical protein